MILNSRSYYSEMQLAIAGLCKALAIPARVAVLQELAKNQNCEQTALIKIGGMAPATIKEHLKELKKAGFIKGSLLKPKLCYCVDWDKLDELKMLVDTLHGEVKQHRDLVTQHKGKCINMV